MKRDSLLHELAERIRAIEAQEHSCRQPNQTVVPGLESILPGSQLPAGSLVELLSAEEGAGAWTLAFIMARHACGEQKALVVADMERRFYPPAASRLGIDLERTIVVRPKQRQQALTALTQSLRCAAVGAALGRLDRLSSADCRRLQCAAEAGGGVGLLLRSTAALGMPSFATVRLVVVPVASANSWRRVQVEVVRFRGGPSGQSLLLEIDDEKGDVRVPAALAAAKSVARPARASG
jgi:hypothetical protein